MNIHERVITWLISINITRTDPFEETGISGTVERRGL